MFTDNEVKSLVDNLQRLYGFGIALAFREALKKFCYKETVPESASGARDNTRIHWSSFPEALSFIVTAGVFFHGMNRFFEKIYVVPGLAGILAKKSGQVLLMVDFGVFFLEALIISVAAFRLTDSAYRFYWALLWLYVVDSVWAIGWILLQVYGVIALEVPVSYNFCILDVIVVAAYACFLVPLLSMENDKLWVRSVLCLITVARTVVDYLINWDDFYFG